jgi:hypothetical protein
MRKQSALDTSKKKKKTLTFAAPLGEKTVKCESLKERTGKKIVPFGKRMI